jgi:hypothetical protein
MSYIAEEALLWLLRKPWFEPPSVLETPHG